MSEDLRSEEIRKMKLKLIAGAAGVVGALYVVDRFTPARAFVADRASDGAAALRSRLPFGGSPETDQVEDDVNNGDDRAIRETSARHGFTATGSADHLS